MADLIIGCGTGRCGTHSLSVLLNERGIKTTHELRLLPWEYDAEKLGILLAEMWQREIRCDVAFSWLNYLPFILKGISDLKVVCLKRDKANTIKSWMKKTHPQSNYWTDPESRWWSDVYIYNGNARFFPKYDAPKEVAIGLYWDEYYQKVDELKGLYPESVRVFESPELFHVEQLQNELWDFVGG